MKHFVTDPYFCSPFFTLKQRKVDFHSSGLMLALWYITPRYAQGEICYRPTSWLKYMLGHCGKQALASITDYLYHVYIVALIPS